MPPGIFILNSVALDAAEDSHKDGIILAVRGIGTAGDDHRARGTADGAGHSLTGDIGAGLIKHIADLDEGDQQDIGLTGYGVVDSLMLHRLHGNSAV